MPSIPPDSAASAELRSAVFRLARRLRRENADDELSPGQIAVLAYLYREGDATPNELSGYEHVTPPSMNRTLNHLQEAGYLARTPGEADRRTVTVSLTAEGRALVEETRRRRDAWLDRRLAGLDPADRASLEDAATVIRKLLDE